MPEGTISLPHPERHPISCPAEHHFIVQACSGVIIFRRLCRSPTNERRRLSQASSWDHIFSLIRNATAPARQAWKLKEVPDTIGRNSDPFRQLKKYAEISTNNAPPLRLSRAEQGEAPCGLT